jgi:hypothetical protein
MMILSEQLISKLSLCDNHEVIGRSLYNNCRVFQSEISGFGDLRFLECDIMGEPTEMIFVFNNHSKKFMECTPEFLDSLDISTMEQLFERELSKTPRRGNGG